MADYIDRKIAIKALDDIISLENLIDTTRKPLELARDIIICRPSPWVSVEDRPPDVADTYIACIVRKEPYDVVMRVVDMVWYDPIEKSWSDVGKFETVTHWMPKPDTPMVN